VPAAVRALAGDGTSGGKAALSASFTNYTWNKNLTINDSSTSYPATTYAHVPHSAIGFANWQGNSAQPAHASDWNVTTPDVFKAIYQAETRRGKQGVLDANQDMPREAMLYAYTINAARAMKQEANVGSIEPGKAADFALVDRDVLTVPAEQMRDMLINSLQSTRLFVVTENQDKADATLRGSAEDLVFTEQHTSSEGINAHMNAGTGRSSGRSGAGPYGGLSVGENESMHSVERRRGDAH